MPKPDPLTQSVPRRPVPGEAAIAMLFCATILAGLTAFSVRWVLRTQTGPKIRSRPLVRRILSTGAADIAGSPRPGRTFRESLEWETTANVPFRIPVLEAACAWERLAGWNVPLLTGYNSVFDGGGGFLGRAQHGSPEALRKSEDSVRTFLGELGGLFPDVPVLYVVPPARFGSGDVLVDGVFDFSNEAADRLVLRVSEAGTEVLDLRAAWAETGRNPRDAFFRTDHHFTPEAGVWAARRIGEALSSRFGVPLSADALSDESFRGNVYRNAFLGSLGKRFTLARCRPDDIAMIGTAAPADFEIEIPSRGIRARGGSKVLIYWRGLRGRSPYDHNAYGAYLFGDNPLVRIRNHDRPDGPRLLVFSDSFDNALSTFLAAAAGEVETIDLRLRKEPLDRLSDDGPFDAIVVFWNSPPEPADLRRAGSRL